MTQPLGMMLFGENFAGKTVVANALKDSFGFNIFPMSSFWLSLMRVEYPATPTFPNKEIAAFRQDYLAVYGTDSVISAINKCRPAVVDGVRSIEMARALVSASYVPVYITAPFEIRARRTEELRPLATGKVGLSAAMLAENDQLHAEQLAEMTQLGGITVINDLSSTPESIAGKLFTVFARAGTVE